MTQLLLLFIIYIMSKPRGDISHTTEFLLVFDDTVKTIYWTCPFLFLLKILGNNLDTFKIQKQVFCYRISHSICSHVTWIYLLKIPCIQAGCKCMLILHHRLSDFKK